MSAFRTACDNLSVTFRCFGFDTILNLVGTRTLILSAWPADDGRGTLLLRLVAL